jgi:hypothetical protein
MKVAIPMSKETLTEPIEALLGRAPVFALVDSECWRRTGPKWFSADRSVPTPCKGFRPLASAYTWLRL